MLVLSVLKNDDSVSWCYIDMEACDVKDILLKHYSNDINMNICLVKHDISLIRNDGGYIRKNESPRKPYSNIKSMRKAFQDDVTNEYIIYDSIEGWCYSKDLKRYKKLK